MNNRALPLLILAIALATTIAAAPPMPPQGFINCVFEGDAYIGGLFEGDCLYNANQSAGVFSNVSNCAVETHETATDNIVEFFTFYPETLGAQNPARITTDAFGYVHWAVPIHDRYIAGQNYTVEVDCAGVQNETTVIVDVGGDSAPSKFAYNTGAYYWTHWQTFIIDVILLMGGLTLAVWLIGKARRGR